MCIRDSGEDLVILACTAFDWSTRVTDRRTDGQTELRWLRHATAVAAVARKNPFLVTAGLGLWSRLHRELLTVYPRARQPRAFALLDVGRPTSCRISADFRCGWWHALVNFPQQSSSILILWFHRVLWLAIAIPGSWIPGSRQFSPIPNPGIGGVARPGFRDYKIS